MANIIHIDFTERRRVADIARERLYQSLAQLAQYRREGVRSLLAAFNHTEAEPEQPDGDGGKAA